MVTCALLAIAVLLWPAGRNRVRTRGAASDDLPARRSPARSSADVGSKRPLRLLCVVAVCGLLVLAVVIAGPAGLLAVGTLIATGRALIRRTLSARRRHLAKVDILAGLRMLSRELRAGAEPGPAAANAAAVAHGDAVTVLTGLAALSRSDDRQLNGPGRGPEVKPASTPATTAAKIDPSTWTMDRLRSGWLLTRRHGLAFTPLIDALVEDLSEQLEAASERSAEVAGPRMSGYVMALLPLLGLALGAGMGADPVHVLLGSSVGNILLVIGVALTCAGLLWSARIVRQ